MNKEELLRELYATNVLTQKHQINKKAQHMLSSRGELVTNILNHTKFLDDSQYSDVMRIRLYCLLHDITELPRCVVCGTPTTFKGTGGFNRYCQNLGKSCASKDTELQLKRTNTLIERYGVENPMKNPDVRLKGKQTLYKNYGVYSPIHADHIRTKIRDTNNERYGSDNVQTSPEIRQRIVDTNMRKYGTTTFAESQISPEIRDVLKNKEKMESYLYDFNILEISEILGVSQFKIRKVLNEHKLNPVDYNRDVITSAPQREISKLLSHLGFEHSINERKVLFPKHLDIYIPSKKLAIEYNGTYFHGELFGKDKEYHIEKYQRCKNSGIRLIQIFSPEWINKRDIVISRIKHALGVSEKVFHARKLQIRRLESKQAVVFFDDHHIQSGVNSSVAYGLFDDENGLVGAMSFSKSRFNKNFQWELMRYSSKINTSVVGGASKLLKHFIREHNPKSIISYCDSRWGTGNLYKTIGFTLLHHSSPNYFYFERNGDTNKLYSRVQFQKHKLSTILPVFSESETEWNNMVTNGYDRIWDCGNDVYGWKADQDILNSSAETNNS